MNAAGTSGPLVVLGAGPAGVGAAFRAARAGHEVVVLERAPRVGGAAGSFEVAGLRVDHGSHRLHAAVPAPILADLRSLLGDDLQQRTRRGRIRLAGRWLGFPPSATGLVRSLPPSFAARLAVDTATGFLRRPRRDTFADVVRARLGPTMLERFYGPYARKLWGLDPERLSGEQARRRIAADTPLALLRRVLTAGDADRRTFLYPRLGFGQIWERLADAARDAGADLRLGTEATGLELDGGAPRVRTAAGTVDAGRVFSTLPLSLLAELTSPSPPPAVHAAARSLRTRAMVLVYVVLPVPRLTPYDAHYLPESWTPLTRISEPKNYRDSAEDPDGLTVLCAELPCDVGDRWWDADDGELGALVTATLARTGITCPSPTDVVTKRLRNAYPVYELGFERHVERLESWAASLTEVLTFGRQGLFVHDNSHHALTMAYAATDALGPDGFDRAAWARAREGFREHVVED